MGISLMMRLILLLNIGIIVQSVSGSQADFEELYQNTTNAVTEVANELSRHLTPSALCAAPKKCDHESCISHGSGSDSFNTEYKCSGMLDTPGQEEKCKDSCKPSDRPLSLSEAFIASPPGTVQYGNQTLKNERDMIIADQEIRRHACALKQMKGVLPDRFWKYGLKNWIYSSSTAGVHASFPGSARSRKSGFDECGFTPMQRPWYVTAATGKKDVVFLFEESLTESSKTSRKALTDTLRTLDPRDYVSVITFSDGGTNVLNSEDKMMPANEANINKLITRVEGLPASAGNPAVTDAFEKAFSVIADSRGSGLWTKCKTSTIIVLLLARAPDCFRHCRQSCTCTGDIVNKIKDLQERHMENFGTHATIVAFSEGDDPHAERLARTLVCERESRGIWQRISAMNPSLSSYGDITSMSLYSENPEPYASAVYLDANGLPDVFTVATAVYEDETRRLVGVVGADITVAQVETLVGKENAMAAIQEKNSKDRRCTKSSTLQGCDLHRVRSRPGSAPCADILPKKPSMCYKFKGRLFRRIEKPMTWEEARRSCQDLGDDSDLANADVKGVRSFLSGFVSYDGSWIGLKASKADTLKWVNGVELSESIEQELFSGKENEKVAEIHQVEFEDACVSLDRRGISQNGNVLPCGVRREGVCEISVGSKAEETHCSEIFDNDNTSHKPVNNNKCESVQSCSEEEDEALTKANPLCKDTTKELKEEDRFCCGGKADESGVCPRAPLPTGAIAGIAVAAVVLIVLCALIVWKVVRRRRDGIYEPEIPNRDEA